MADQNIKIDVKLGNGLSASEAFAQALRNQGTAAADVAQKIADLNAKNAVTRATIKGVTADNQQYTLGLKRVGTELQAVKLRLDDMGNAYKKVQAEAKKFQQAQERAQGAGLASDILSKSLAKGGFGLDAATVPAKFLSELEKVKAAVAKAAALPSIGKSQIDAVAAALHKGQTLVGDAETNKLIAALTKARDLVIKIAQDQAKITSENAAAATAKQKELQEQQSLNAANALALQQAKVLATVVAQRKAAAEQQAAIDKQNAINAKLTADNATRALQQQAAAAAALQARQQAGLAAQRGVQAGVGVALVQGQFPAPTSANIQQLLAYENSLRRIRELIASGATNVGEIRQIIAAFSSGTIAKGLSTGGNQAQQILADLQTAYTKTKSVGELASDSLGKAWNRLSQILTVTAIHQIVGRLTSAFQASIEESANFQVRIAEIRTLAQDSALSFGEWARGVNALSGEFGRNQADVAAGAYEILSNQVAKGRAVFGTLRTALELGRTTVSTTEQAVNALTGAMTSFGLKTSDQERIAAGLFRTVDLGRVRLSELSNTIGRIGPAASLLGISLEEVEAGLTTLTIQGIKNSDATTLLTNIVLKLLKPTEEMKLLFKDLGVESGQLAISTFGLGGFLQKMADAVGNNVARYGELGGELRAIKGFIGLARDGANDFNNALTQITNSQEIYSRAIGEFTDNKGQKFIEQMNEVKLFFSNTVATVLIDSLIKVTTFAGGLANVLKIASTIGIGLGVVWIAMRLNALRLAGALTIQNAVAVANVRSMTSMGVAANAAQVAQVRLQGALAVTTSLLGGLALVTVVGSSLLSLAEASHILSAEATEAAENVRDEFKKITISEASESSKRAQEFDAGLAKQLQTVLKYTTDVTKLGFQLSENLKNIMARTNENLKVSFDGLVNFMSRRITDLNRVISESKSKIEQSRKIVADFEANAQASQFQRQEKFEGNPLRSVQRISNRIRQLQSENAALAGRTDTEAVERMRKNSEEVIRLIEQREDKLVDIRRREAERSGAAGVLNEFGQREIDVTDIVAQGQRAINDEIQKRTELEKSYQAAQEETAKKAKAQLVIEQARKFALDQAAKAITDFSVFDKEGKFKPEFKGGSVQESTGKAQAEFDRRINTLLKAAGGDKDIEKQLSEILEIEEKRKVVGLQVNAAIASDKLVQDKLALDKYRDDLVKARREAEEADKKAGEVRNQSLDSLNAKLKLIEETTRKISSYGIFGTSNFTIAGTALPDPTSVLPRGVNLDLINQKEKFQQALKLAQDAQKAIREGDTSPQQVAFAKQRIQELIDAYNELGKSAQKAGLAAGLLNTAIGGEGNKGAVTITQVFASVAAELDRIGKAQEGIKTANQNLLSATTNADTLAAAVAKSEQAFAKLPGVANPAGDAIMQAFRNSNSEVERLIGSLGEVARQIEALNRQSLRIPVAPLRPAAEADGFAGGGPVFRPRGTDTVPAMLTPGEYVMDRHNTSKFFPQLRMMSQGIGPRYYNQGGSVTNVGDINVSVSGRDQDVGRTIGMEVRRQIRRNNF